MSNSSEGQIDQLVKAKWLELGLSQTDLAEVLGAEPGQARNGAGESGHVKVDRLLRVAEALGVSADLLDGDARPISHEKNKGSSPPDSGSLQSLLELRLLRVFRKLQDHHTKRMLIDLIEQIVKRQVARPGDAG